MTPPGKCQLEHNHTLRFSSAFIWWLQNIWPTLIHFTSEYFLLLAKYQYNLSKGQLSGSAGGPSFQLTVSHSPCCAPVVEDAYREIPKVSQSLVCYTSKSLGKARLWEKHTTKYPQFLLFMWAAWLQQLRLLNLAFILLHGIMRNRSFLTTTGSGLLFS